MIRYLLLCLLIAPQVFGKAECEYSWFKCSNNTRPINCASEQNVGWIRNSKVCNGASDCADGSDESLVTCKLHPTWHRPNLFYCASGGVIEDNLCCNGQADCWDNSDELNCNDNSADKALQGHCSTLEMECLPGECISVDKLCNHEIDCSNGRDESLAQCIEECETGQFQCGYGLCISNDQLCDNKPDCLDGADELLNVCEDAKGYIPKQYHNCTEPPGHNRPKFVEDTKYRLNHRGKKYVFPNEPVHFQCGSWAKLNGSPWNVCQLNGTWHHALPHCRNKYPKRT